MLKKIADKKNLITVVLAGILLVLWLLYLLFGGGEQKIAMLVLTPVLAVVFYGFLRLILKVVGKAASPKTMSAFIGFFLIAGTLGFLLMLLEYISPRRSEDARACLQPPLPSPINCNIKNDKLRLVVF